MARCNGESNILSVILGSFCWLILISLLLLPITLLFIFKCCVIGVAYIVHDNLYSISTTDAAFAIGCSWKKSKLSVGLLLQVQGQVELAQVQNKFYTSLLQQKVGNKPKYEKLYSCLVTFGGYVFRKLLPMDSLQLDKHIYVRNLKGGESLDHVIQEWMEQSYAEYAPAWEVMMVPFVPETGDKSRVYQTAVCFKIHHVFADGYSLLHILDTLTDHRSGSPYLVKDPNESWSKRILDVLSLPVNLRYLGGDASPKYNPIKIPAPQQYWRYTFTGVDVELVKSIRKKYEVHFASVMLTLTAGSIRQFILETHSEKQLPNILAIADTLPLWPQHPALQHHLCNHWTLGVIKTPAVGDDALTRLLETEKYFLQFHQAGLQKVATNYLFPLAWLLPAVVSEKALETDKFGFNLGLTSLVGGTDYKFLGNNVDHIYPLLTLVDSHPYTAFSWFTFSHSGKLDITLAAAPCLFPGETSMSRMTSQYFQTELEKLCEQCGISYTTENTCVGS
ncbi:unnamed protein product [Orchesella dallaii]|uniref:O-acyltransferase WSD1 C-terminal domain-containing protein n=1 Tax=Orchesella dallaii TaxID=48710 RepID=A0ABP1R7T7_9HEXA